MEHKHLDAAALERLLAVDPVGGAE